jgi:hypothetical protein
MTSNKKEMLQVAIALNGEYPKEGHRCSVAPPCFCCKYDNYQKDFAKCLKKYENEDIDYYYEKHCKEEPKSYFTRSWFAKVRWYSAPIPGVCLSYQCGNIYDEIIIVHKYYQEIWCALNWFVLKAKLLKNTHTNQLNYLSEHRIHFPNMLLLNICRYINAEMRAFVEFHTHTKEEGFPMIRSYLEYPMRAHNAIE